MRNTVFVSATPGEYEVKHSGTHLVEQLIRPTGLLDPVIEVRPVGGQVDDLLHADQGARGKPASACWSLP